MRKSRSIKDISFNMVQGEILGSRYRRQWPKELLTLAVYIQLKGRDPFKGKTWLASHPRNLLPGISMSFIPEDRLGMGLAANMDMVDNILLKQYHHSKGMG